MPNKQAAKKYLRQSEKRALKNRLAKNKIKSQLRKCRKNIEANKIEELKENTKKAIKLIDKASQKGLLKKNTAARKKSRLMKKINAITK
jgi:small subunit ribosomal protein S20